MSGRRGGGRGKGEGGGGGGREGGGGKVRVDIIKHAQPCARAQRQTIDGFISHPTASNSYSGSDIDSSDDGDNRTSTVWLPDPVLVEVVLASSAGTPQVAEGAVGIQIVEE